MIAWLHKGGKSMKKKIIKTLVLLIVIILILFLINLLRNYFILNKLKDKINELNELDIFSEVIKTEKDETKITKYKNISKVEFVNKDTIMYFNSDTDELIEENIKTGERKYYTDRLSSVNLILLHLNEDFFEIMLKNVITTKDINGEKCYKIKVDSLKQTYYVSAEEGITMEIHNRDSEKNYHSVVSYSYQFDNINAIDFEELKKTATDENVDTE